MPRKNNANRALHQIVIGGGKLIYLPNTPEVLMHNMAKLSNKIL